ncbi:Eukaryotic translation initiation factor 1b, partial [Acipenser ruthenus]
DATKGDDLLPAGTEEYIHIRIQQRNGRKTLTTVQGIADDYDKKKLVKAFKKKFACNGTVIEHPEYGEVIQLQGDQRKNICQFLLEVTPILGMVGIVLLIALVPEPPRGAADFQGEALKEKTSYWEDIKYLFAK